MEEESGPRPIRPRDWALVAVTVLPLLALAVVAIVSVGHGYHGADDNAMTELRISDIGRHWPQIGPFSRDGWSHPGPAVFYTLRSPTASPAATPTASSSAPRSSTPRPSPEWCSSPAATAARRSPLLVALGSLVLMSSLGSTFLWNPWNPYLTVLPFGLAVLATWCVVRGDVWCLPLLAAVGSFGVQTHIGYAPLVAALGLVAVIGLVVHLRNERHEGRATAPLRWPLLASAGILVVAWAPAVYQQLTAEPGNVGAIWDYFRSSRSVHSLREGLGVVTAQFAWDPGWLVGRTDVNPFTAQPLTLASLSWPLWWIALAGALAWCWYTGRRTARALGIVLVVMIATSVVAVARTLGPVYEYRLRFVWVLGMLTAAYVTWIVTRLVLARVRTPGRWVSAGTAIGVAGVVGLSVYGVATAAGTEPPNREEGRVVAALVHQLLGRLPSGPGVVVPSTKTFGEGPLLTGLMVDLEHHGIPVRIRPNPDNRLRFGDHRMLAGERVRAELRIAGDEEIQRVAQTPCARMLAYSGRAPERCRRAPCVRRPASSANSRRSASHHATPSGGSDVWARSCPRPRSSGSAASSADPSRSAGGLRGDEHRPPRGRRRRCDLRVRRARRSTANPLPLSSSVTACGFVQAQLVGLVDPAVATVGLPHEDHDATLQAVAVLGRVHAEHPGVVVVEHVADVEPEVAAGRRHVEREHSARRERREHARPASSAQRVEPGPRIGRVLEHLAGGGHRDRRPDRRRRAPIRP